MRIKIRNKMFMRYARSNELEQICPSDFQIMAGRDRITRDGTRHRSNDRRAATSKVNGVASGVVPDDWRTAYPESTGDLPDDDWDAWLAGADECPNRRRET